MIVTDSFVFVHLHKAGGSFVIDFVQRFFSSARFIGYHYPIVRMPADAVGLPVLGSVRNPWDWYVSYYFFQQQLLTAARERIAATSPAELAAQHAVGDDPMNGVDVLFEETSHDGADGFATTTRRILDLGVDDAVLDRLLHRLPTRLDRRGRDTVVQRHGFRGMNLRAQDLLPIRGSGRGLCSHLCRHLFGDTEVRFVRTESLRADLVAVLEEIDVPLTPAMRDHLAHAAPVNPSPHAAAAGYFDAALVAEVRLREAEFLDRFGYELEPHSWGAS